MDDAGAPIDHLAQVQRETSRFADLVARGPLDAVIAACPGWDLRRLALHLGGVQRWCAEALRTAAEPAGRGARPTGEDAAELAAWLRAGAQELVEVAAGIAPDAPTWHPFPAPQVAGVWRRRQAHEALVHRWDAEHALGDVTPVDAAQASDAVDEYFEVMLPRVVGREALTLPGSSLHVHCTDTHGEWLVQAESGHVALRREHAKGDAALRGPAEALLLRLWGRPVPDGMIDVIGDADAADAWLSLGGA